MKFVVPFTIPMTRRSRSPVSDSFSGRISGMPAADRRLEVQVQALGVRRVEQLPPARGEQLLVRGHDRLVAVERGQDQRPGGFEPADQLADDVDVRVVDHGDRVVHERRRCERDVPRLRRGRGRPPCATSSRHPARRSMSSRWLVEQADDRGARRCRSPASRPAGPARSSCPSALALRHLGPIGHQYVAPAGADLRGIGSLHRLGRRDAEQAEEVRDRLFGARGRATAAPA